MSIKYKSYCDSCESNTIFELVTLMDIDGIESTAVECEDCGHTEEVSD